MYSPSDDSPRNEIQAMPGSMQTPPTKRSDPFVDAIASIRDLVLHVIKVANWRFTFACMFAFASRMTWSYIPEDMPSRGLLTLAALSLGACIGRLIDRRASRRRAADRERADRSSHLATVLTRATHVRNLDEGKQRMKEGSA